MKWRTTFFLFVTIFVFTSSISKAEIQYYTFDGVFNSVQDVGNIWSQDLTVGSTFAGYFRFDDSTLVTNSQTDTFSSYFVTGQFEVKINDNEFYTSPDSQLELYLTNNSFYDNLYSDVIQIYARDIQSWPFAQYDENMLVFSFAENSTEPASMLNSSTYDSSINFNNLGEDYTILHVVTSSSDQMAMAHEVMYNTTTPEPEPPLEKGTFDTTTIDNTVTYTKELYSSFLSSSTGGGGGGSWGEEDKPELMIYNPYTGEFENLGSSDIEINSDKPIYALTHGWAGLFQEALGSNTGVLREDIEDLGRHLDAIAGQSTILVYNWEKLSEQFDNAVSVVGLDAIAEHFYNELESVINSEDEIVLIGHSLGAGVVSEVARNLVMMDYNVDSLILLDRASIATSTDDEFLSNHNVDIYNFMASDFYNYGAPLVHAENYIVDSVNHSGIVEWFEGKAGEGIDSYGGVSMISPSGVSYLPQDGFLHSGSISDYIDYGLYKLNYNATLAVSAGVRQVVKLMDRGADQPLSWYYQGAKAQWDVGDAFIGFTSSPIVFYADVEFEMDAELLSLWFETDIESMLADEYFFISFNDDILFYADGNMLKDFSYLDWLHSGLLTISQYAGLSGRLAFGFMTERDGVQVRFKDLEVFSSAPVPEPATMLLFGTGLIGLIGSRLRKKNK